MHVIFFSDSLCKIQTARNINTGKQKIQVRKYVHLCRNNISSKNNIVSKEYS